MSDLTRPEGADILMITHERTDYLRLALPRLLESLGPDDRVWLWHNGEHAETLAYARSFEDHPGVARFHHCPENVPLREPTNWLWREAEGTFVSKVDDDCLVDPGWLTTLKAAHRDYDRFGILGTWRFYDEDFRPELANRKMATFGGHEVMRNLWVQGSGYLMRRSLADEHGPIRDDESFPAWCIRVTAASGHITGWYHPFIHEEHMDDPRSPNSQLRSDEVFLALRPLSAVQRGITTVSAWEDRMKMSALEVQRASLDPRDLSGWRLRKRRLVHKAQARLQRS